MSPRVCTRVHRKIRLPPCSAKWSGGSFAPAELSENAPGTGAPPCPRSRTMRSTQHAIARRGRGLVARATFPGLIRSANLDEPVTRFKSLQQVWPESPKQFNKKDPAAVADADPDQASVRVPQRVVREVLVFDSRMRRTATLPRARLAAEVRIDIARERRRKRILDEERHAERRTG